MKVTVRHIGHVSIVDLSGQFTIGEGDCLIRDTINSLLDDDRRNIILNLDKVSRMDSASIGQLIAMYKAVSEYKGSVKLLNPRGEVYDSLLMTKIGDLFESFKDENEALVSFRIVP